MSLYNKIKYGNSDKPRFITAKGQWLYKNKWIKASKAYGILDLKEPQAYEYKVKDTNHRTYMFDEVLSDTLAHPFDIEFLNFNQFSTYQFKLLTTAIENAAKNKIAKFTHIFD